VEPYDQIVESFVPSMEAAGYSAELINKLMHENPWKAYSR
jgi:predicted metal-dependent phosphotriesterase family hydrolase